MSALGLTYIAFLIFFCYTATAATCLPMSLLTELTWPSLARPDRMTGGRDLAFTFCSTAARLSFADAVVLAVFFF
jgi:hypothetical protein